MKIMVQVTAYEEDKWRIGRLNRYLGFMVSEYRKSIPVSSADFNAESDIDEIFSLVHDHKGCCCVVLKRQYSLPIAKAFCYAWGYFDGGDGSEVFYIGYDNSIIPYYVQSADFGYYDKDTVLELGKKAGYSWK